MLFELMLEIQWDFKKIFLQNQHVLPALLGQHIPLPPCLLILGSVNFIKAFKNLLLIFVRVPKCVVVLRIDYW